MGIHHRIKFTHHSNPERNSGRILFGLIETGRSFKNSLVECSGCLGLVHPGESLLQPFLSLPFLQLPWPHLHGQLLQSFAGHHLLPSHPESIGKEKDILPCQLFPEFLCLLIILPDGLPGQPGREGQPSDMTAHTLEDHFLNEVVESQTTGRTTAHHDNGTRSHLQGLNKVSQNDLEGKADTFIRMEDTEGQRFSGGFRRNDIRNLSGLCNGLAEDMHRTQVRKSHLHPCLPTTFFPAGRGLSSWPSFLSFHAASAISP